MRFFLFIANMFKLTSEQNIFKDNLVFAVCTNKITLNYYRQISLDRSKSLISLKL